MKGLNLSTKELNRQHRMIARAMKFLDSQFRNLDEIPQPLQRWPDVKKAMSALSGRMRGQFDDMPRKMADVIAFSALEDAVDREKKQLCPDFKDIVEDWWNSIPLHHAPLYHETANVAFDMAKGYSEKEARKFHTVWLDENDNNRMYDGYYYAPDGTVVNISETTIVGEA